MLHLHLALEILVQIKVIKQGLPVFIPLLCNDNH